MSNSKNKNIRYKNFSIPVVFQNKDVIVMNKPAGLLTVPIPKSTSPNLEEALSQILRHVSTEIQAAHRIDRYTSGLVVFALNPKAHEQLVEAFQNQVPRRVYRALVWGEPKEQDTLVNHLKRIKQSFKNVPVGPKDEEGTRAELSYRTLARYKSGAIVEIELETGLKNQIRAQFAEAHIPIIGDRQYGRGEQDKKLGVKRQMLHAYQLELPLPFSDKVQKLTCEAPKDFSDALNVLKKNDKKR